MVHNAHYHVKTVLTGLLMYFTQTGCTGQPGINAPGKQRPQQYLNYETLRTLA